MGGLLLATMLDNGRGFLGVMDNRHFEEKLQRLKENSDSQNVLTVTDQPGITRIPECIRCFSEITSLDLRNNSIEEIPWSLSYLRNLRYLNLDENRLTVIPGFIAMLVSLEFLSLQQNQIKRLPTELLLLKNLQTLKVRGNRMESPSYYTCAFGWEPIKLSLQLRLERHNIWKETTGYFTDPTLPLPSLCELCAKTVLDMGIDLFESPDIPIVMRNYLMEQNETQFQICKCSQCGGCFSTRFLYATHTCESSVIKVTQFIKNKDFKREMPDNDTDEIDHTQNPKCPVKKKFKIPDWIEYIFANYLIEQNEIQFQICKCSYCLGYFSTWFLYANHTCESSAFKVTQFAKNKDFTRVTEMPVKKKFKMPDWIGNAFANYLMEQNETQFEICKCSQCLGYFSTRFLYATHTCESSAIKVTQFAKNKDFTRVTEMPDNETDIDQTQNAVCPVKKKFKIPDWIGNIFAKKKP